MINLGCVLRLQDRLEEVESVDRTALAILNRVLGKDHPDTLSAALNIVCGLYDQKRNDEAGPRARELFDRCRRVLGELHPRTCRVQDIQYRITLALGDNEQARALATDLMTRYRALAAKKDTSIPVLRMYAWFLLTVKPEILRQPAEAVKVAERARMMGGGRDARLLDTLALAYFLTGQRHLALKTQEEAIMVDSFPHVDGLTDVQQRYVDWSWRSHGYFGIVRAIAVIMAGRIRSRNSSSGGTIATPRYLKHPCMVR